MFKWMIVWPENWLERFLYGRQQRLLVPIADEAGRRLEGHIRQRYPDAVVYWNGLTGIDPTTLAYVLKTATEAQRHELERDATCFATLRAALADLGYPRWAAAKVPLFVTSQQAEDEADNLDIWGNPRVS